MPACSKCKQTYRKLTGRNRDRVPAEVSAADTQPTPPTDIMGEVLTKLGELTDRITMCQDRMLANEDAKHYE